MEILQLCFAQFHWLTSKCFSYSFYVCEDSGFHWRLGYHTTNSTLCWSQWVSGLRKVEQIDYIDKMVLEKGLKFTVGMLDICS